MLMVKWGELKVIEVPGKIRHFLKTICLSLIAVSMPVASVSAQQTSSSSYSLYEVQFGSGSVLDAASASFQAKASLGDLVVGNSASTAFQLFGGFTTTDQPYLEFYVDATAVDFVEINTDCSSNGTAFFYVRSYLASSYNVTVIGGDLTSENGDTITTSTTPATCTVDQEFFGLNLVANTGFGANPVQVPDASFSFGQVAAGYNTADNFQYNPGDIIAQSSQSSGQTNYTVSYVANAAPVTEAGLYQARHTLIATSYF